MHKQLEITFSKYQQIVFVGGGTGGHISPIIALSRELKNKNILWIWKNNSQESKSAKEVGIKFASIPTIKLTTTRSFKVFLYPFYILLWVFYARKILKRFCNSQTCIFSKGWPWSLSVGLAWWSLGIDLYIHESDTIPWRSNTLLGKIANRVFLGFASARQYFSTKKCEVIWQIIDPLLEQEKPTNGKIHWNTRKRHILVLCWSQWARAIFYEIIQNLETILQKHELIIILGNLNTDMRSDFLQAYHQIQSNQKDDSLQVLDWLDKVEQRYIFSTTDIAITRGSATTLAELDVFDIKKIIIPLPSSARNHQYWNAREYEENWDFLLEQKNIKQLSSTLLRE